MNDSTHESTTVAEQLSTFLVQIFWLPVLDLCMNVNRNKIIKQENERDTNICIK